jgi:uncharacterized protein (DUF427 family)
MKAVWKGTVIAESEDTVVVEGNHYFPRDSITPDHFRPSVTTSICPWKGQAEYFDVMVDGEVNKDAAWFYDAPKAAAQNISGRVAFWRGVTVAP